MAWCWARRPPGSAVLPGALAGQGQEELRGGEASSGEGAGDRTRHLLGFSSLDHGDRGAAEAASGHAGSMCTGPTGCLDGDIEAARGRSEEHTSELQSRGHLVCRLLLEKKQLFTSLCKTVTSHHTLR